MKYDVLPNSEVLSEQLQRLPVFVSLALSNVRMGRARDDIRNIAVLRQNARQGLYDGFNSLIWREQAEGQQYRLAPNSEAVLVKIRIDKRQVGNSMRDDVNLCRRDLEDLLEKLRRVLAHLDKAVGELWVFALPVMVVGVGFARHRRKGGHDGHVESSQQLQDVTRSEE